MNVIDSIKQSRILSENRFTLFRIMLRGQPKATDLNFLVCSVSARSVGSRSMEEAP